jgi:uncharacterized protein (DUF58 family)
VSGWPRPARPRTPIFVAAGVVAIWWLVAHNGGAGWVQFVGDLVFGTLLVGIAGPGVVAGRVRVAVRDAPADGVAGLPMQLDVAASSRVRVRPVDPPGPEAFVGPAAGKGQHHLLTLLPERRGVYGTVVVEVASAAPFALQWWSRRVTLALPQELHVAPRLGRPEPQRPGWGEQAGAVVVRPRTDTGFPRGARPYVTGDARHRVHWRATAHTGVLMVKELDRPSGQPVTVVVDLPRHPDEAERAAERAMGTVVRFLDGGAVVLLQTRERSGTVTELVTDRRRAGRRMARAVSRPDAAHGDSPAAR